MFSAGSDAAGLARDNRTEQQEQAQGDDDVVELVEDDEPECDLSDYLTMTCQWSDMDEQATPPASHASEYPQLASSIMYNACSVIDQETKPSDELTT
ncbi:unnamed protein product [Taenia asiatica]|uniref:Uncharacterized protein n=1 Tax=Taenia asiatica TaxID=60517 RepID=A0A0R3WFP2_TAEAS|nr:unnamed protein product [Taenia asiatica]